MIKRIILPVILIIVFFLAEVAGFSKILHPQKWIILAFFVAIDYLFNLLTEQGMKNNREKFIEFYLSTVIIRFVLTIVFIALELYFKVEKPFLFVGNFFALYLCFTIFEISNLYSKLRRF
jgi:hypothetical protein